LPSDAFFPDSNLTLRAAELAALACLETGVFLSPSSSSSELSSRRMNVSKVADVKSG